MGLRVITPPSEIITVAEAAEFLRADFSDDEQPVIEAMITAARQWVEEYLRRSIGAQTLEITIENFPSRGRQAILLRPPVIEVVDFTYLDADGDSQTLVEDVDFRIALDSEPGEVTPVSAWPIALGTADCVRLRYQCGYYGSGSPVNLPKTIRTAILMQVADLYNNREAYVERPLSANPTLERLLSPYRLEMGV